VVLIEESGQIDASKVVAFPGNPELWQYETPHGPSSTPGTHEAAAAATAAAAEESLPIFLGSNNHSCRVLPGTVGLYDARKILNHPDDPTKWYYEDLEKLGFTAGA
jgi:hypothetical protein